MAGLAGIILGETLLSPEHEVLYSGSMAVAHCISIGDRQACTFNYDFSIGNTGKQEQESLRIVWPLDMQDWGVGTHVSDIIASARKTQEPRIRREFESGKTIYAISALMPNTMVLFQVRCLMCTPAELHAMQQARVTVEARGAVSEADPRVSALSHGAMNLLRVFGLFN
ncbi:MAG: hypothetical protein IH605_00480 [Burkholderiales bacterium]|nr:hypothetical protein [Burkholderiales bacterium]